MPGPMRHLNWTPITQISAWHSCDSSHTTYTVLCKQQLMKPHLHSTLTHLNEAQPMRRNRWDYSHRQGSSITNSLHAAPHNTLQRASHTLLTTTQHIWLLKCPSTHPTSEHLLHTSTKSRHIRIKICHLYDLLSNSYPLKKKTKTKVILSTV